MNKCKWEDGKFVPCLEADSEFSYPKEICNKLRRCPFCGADIRKPEPPEPLIVKSGDTWVAHWDGEDYLYIGRNWQRQLIDGELLIKRRLEGDKTAPWKPFSEIKLTDKIAKLRPFACFWDNNKLDLIYTLIYVAKTGCETYACYGPEEAVYIWKNCRLATAKEIMERNNNE